MTIRHEDPVVDRSKYAELFAELHQPENWGEWIVVDTVSGGGLASRLRRGGYRGMKDLEFEVMTNTGPLGHKVFVKVTGRRAEERR